jgi:hypothetical protein
VQVFRYRSGPIAITVSFADGALSGVALDVARFGEMELPGFTQRVWPGVNRDAVLQLLGAPAEDHRREQYGMALEQMIFQPVAIAEVSVFFIDGWAVKTQTGRAIPADVFAVALPVSPTATGEAVDACDDGWEKGDGQVRLGTTEDDVKALYGHPKLHVEYRFKGRPADYAIYEAHGGRSFARFTFIDGVVTEFADGGETPLNQVLDGR